jgi:DNA-binding protein HU-beta
MKDYVNSKELVKRTAETANVSRYLVNKVIEALVASSADALSEGKSVKISGLGTISVAEQDQRKAYVPTRGASIDLPPRRVVKMKPSPSLQRKACSSKETDD